MEELETCLRDDGQIQCRRHIRGFLEPSLLLLLHLNNSYGYDLATALGTFGLGGVDSSLVYRMLRDLETAGLVDSEWESTTSVGPARRMYRITVLGESQLDDWVSDLRNTDRVLHYFLQVYDCHMLASERQRSPERSPGSRKKEAPDQYRTSAGETRLEEGGKQVSRVVVSSNGYDLDALISPVFGRCAAYVFVDVDTMEFEAIDNPAANAGGGAGIQAAQLVIEKGAEAALTGNVGPNAFDVFRSANFPVYLVAEHVTVRQAVEQFKNGKLESSHGPNVKAHAGMRRPRGLNAVPDSPVSPDARQEELTELRKVASDLRKQLADVITRIEKLEVAS
jgi:predicted Fe-Mo cluster-binding NifX family protein/DNA-binding PadR family transcriptional regulator